MGSRRLTKVMVVAVAAAVFTGAGLVYAHWNTSVGIDGEIRTGQVGTYWTTWACADTDGSDDLTAMPVGWVGHANWELVGSNVPPGFDVWKTDRDVARTAIQSLAGHGVPTVMFDIDNAYPSHYEDCEWGLGNIGSIPLAAPYAVLRALSPETTFASAIFAEDGVLWIDFRNGFPLTQVNPQQSEHGSFRIHIEQIAEQDASYAFEIAVCLHNWNETSTATDDVCGLYEPHELVDGTVMVIPEP